MRNYTFGINVETAEELGAIGKHVGKFIAGLGDGDCEIQVAINPALADGDYEERTPVIGFLADGNAEQIEYYEEEDEGEAEECANNNCAYLSDSSVLRTRCV